MANTGNVWGDVNNDKFDSETPEEAAGKFKNMMKGLKQENTELRNMLIQTQMQSTGEVKDLLKELLMESRSNNGNVATEVDHVDHTGTD